jgi:ubiquinone/menaquinone biosynthesis C-methylase UbiE
VNSEISVEMERLRTKDRSERVRDVFENAPHYLRTRRVDILFRMEVVRTFAETIRWQRMLDVGCGDGSISLPLLTRARHLTLMDLSASMLELAQENIPKTLAGNVVVRNENFSEAVFDSAPFDLIVTVGVMAHVDAPDAFLAKIRRHLRPGGSLIIEFTDAQHIVGRVGRFMGRIKECAAPARYETNKLAYAEVAALFEKHQLRLVSTFRYARIPLPGIDRMLSHRLQYLIAKRLFNNCDENTNARLGNEYICLLTAE